VDRGGVITKIEVQKRHPSRRSLFINDAFVVGLDEQIVLKKKLNVGQALTHDEVEALLLSEKEEKAREYGLTLLSYRDRSCREVRDRLREKGYGADIIDRVIDSFRRTHLLDDERFARDWGRERLRNKPMGARLLQQELWRKGIPIDLIERTVEHLYTESNEAELAAVALKGRKERYSLVEGEKGRKRMADFLLRRGFSWDVVADALEAVQADERTSGSVR